MDKDVAVGVIGPEAVVGVSVGDSGVEVTAVGEGEPSSVVKVGRGVCVSTVAVGGGVDEEIALGVGVMKIGDPRSLQPRSGAGKAC